MELAPADNDKGDNGNELYKMLADSGINTHEALTYCGGSDEFYRNMLCSFPANSENLINAMNDALGSGDLKMYAVKV